MRHRLVHVYFAINLDFVWEVVVRDLPVLTESLSAVLNARTTPGDIQTDPGDTAAST